MQVLAPDGLIHGAIEKTIAEGSARLLWASPEGGPVPEPEDGHGEGVADFTRDRVWIDRYRATTQASATELRERAGARFLPRLIAHLHGRLGNTPCLYFEGMSRYKKRRKGGWSEPFSLPEFRQTDHPLWLLRPLARMSTEPAHPEPGEMVRGVATTRYSLGLTAQEVAPPTWQELAPPDAQDRVPRSKWWKPGPHPAPRSLIQAFVWLDAQHRIRRMSYQLTFDHPMLVDGVERAIPPVWQTTEFWDFGVRIDRQAPLRSASPR